MPPGTPEIIMALAALALVLAAGCAGTPDEAGALYTQAQAGMNTADYRSAASLYEEAYHLYENASDTKNALAARNGMLRANRMTMEFPFDRSGAEADLKAKVPGITDAEVNEWLSERAQTIESDGETLYYEEVSSDYLYAHPELLWEDVGKKFGFEYLSRYALENGSSASGGGPVHYAGTETLDIPAEYLPATGVLKIWFPLPLETGSQRNVSVANLSYEDCIVAGPVTEGRIGYVYYEIPAERIDGNLTVSADVGYVSYPRTAGINPEDVGDYDTADPEYQAYTKSTRNIEITDEIRAKAYEIVGNETNPYFQAQKIYRYIVDTYPYSHVPHLMLDTAEPKIAESSYMYATGHGDCGTQSMLFAALCRSIGIPARATGGYQMLLSDTPGTHFWAEYYIEGCGWIPCDPTVAEIADWLNTTEENREAFKDALAASLDPTRFVIQADVDAEMTPAIPDDAVSFRLVRQYPAIEADAADDDLEVLAAQYFTVDLHAV